MPPKLRAATCKSLLSLARNTGGNKVAITAEGTVFYCPSCSTWRRRTVSTSSSTYRARIGGLRHDLYHRADRNNNVNNTARIVRRYLSSSSAARSNASVGGSAGISKNVPARFRELYTALKELEDFAADHISLSRLQLAQRGLESEESVVRVAGIYPLNTTS